MMKGPNKESFYKKPVHLTQNRAAILCRLAWMLAQRIQLRDMRWSFFSLAGLSRTDFSWLLSSLGIDVPAVTSAEIQRALTILQVNKNYRRFPNERLLHKHIPDYAAFLWNYLTILKIADINLDDAVTLCKFMVNGKREDQRSGARGGMARWCPRNARSGKGPTGGWVKRGRTGTHRDRTHPHLRSAILACFCYIDNKSMLCYKLLFRNSKKSEGAIRYMLLKPL